MTSFRQRSGATGWLAPSRGSLPLATGWLPACVLRRGREPGPSAKGKSHWCLWACWLAGWLQAAEAGVGRGVLLLGSALWSVGEAEAGLELLQRAHDQYQEPQAAAFLQQVGTRSAGRGEQPAMPQSVSQATLSSDDSQAMAG